MNLERLTLPALVAQWARIVDYVERHAMPLPEYAADLDVRHEIAQRIRSRPATRETREMLAELDDHFRAITQDAPECIHGVARATVEGWTSAREWYYWRTPGIS